MTCPSCHGEVLDIDVKCSHCGAALGPTGAHRMLGQVVLGTYELIDVLGQGGMSVVFKARHKLTDQEVALEILPPELAANSQVKWRFLEEAKALAALDHREHRPPLQLRAGELELRARDAVRPGQDVGARILEHRRLDWRASTRIAIDVLKALEYAHGRGVVHRDMKPSNVLVRAHDATATVMDFGIAKMTTSTRLTATGQTMGTVRYMSPEQVRGQEVDLRTDIYSLGATLYESLVGDTPFDGNTHFEIMTKHLCEAPKRPSTLGVELPEQVEDALVRSLAKRADDRFESARDMRRLLESRCAKAMSGSSKPSGSGARPSRSCGRRRWRRRAPRPSLADVLEPSARMARIVVGRPRWPWAVLGIVLAGSAGAVTYVDDPPNARYALVAQIDGVRLNAGKRYGHLLVETDGLVTPDRVHTQLEQTLGELRGSSEWRRGQSWT